MVNNVYKAVVKRVYDAETIVVNIDLGFGSWLHHFKLKLKGIDAIHKRKGPEQDDAITWLSDKILYREIVIVSFPGKGKRRGKYEVFIYKDQREMFSSVNLFGDIITELVQLGYAQYTPNVKSGEYEIEYGST